MTQYVSSKLLTTTMDLQPKRCFMVQGFTLNMLWVSFYVTQRVVWYFYLQSLHGEIFLLLRESVRACNTKFIFWLLASPYILWLSGDRQLWCSITVGLFHSFYALFFILDGPNYESRCDRSALWLLSSQGFREMKHCVACSPFLLKTPKPLNSNFATVQSKVMKLRYSLEGESSPAQSALLYCRPTSPPPRLPIKGLWSAVDRISMSSLILLSVRSYIQGAHIL